MLQAIYQTPFGIADPVFSRDIGFYVFTLPALSTGARLPARPRRSSRSCSSSRSTGVRGDLIPRAPGGSGSSRRPGIHLAILLAVLFLLAALRLWLVDIPSLLYSTTGPLVGASYTDLHARLPAMRLSGGGGRRWPPWPS